MTGAHCGLDESGVGGAPSKVDPRLEGADSIQNRPYKQHYKPGAVGGVEWVRHLGLRGDITVTVPDTKIVCEYDGQDVGCIFWSVVQRVL